MIQVAPCEQALVKQIGNQFKTIRAKHGFFSKLSHWNLSLLDFSSTRLAISQ